MGKRYKVAWVSVIVFEEDGVDGYQLELQEWRRGRPSNLTLFCELGPFGLSPSEQGVLIGAVEESVSWLVGDAVALDSGRML